ncbi:MAG: LamG domain-containing protein [Verrucomicrobia bacterium]|nr:LamG domain-containing protein [Verrucomicrobiota bacterium]
MKTASLLPAMLLLSGASVARAATPFPGIAGDKTLVVWAAPSNATQRGGSALTLEDRRSHFDGIVFGEVAPARWMAGSDFYRRTRQAQDDVPQESEFGGALVQIAIVYRGKQVEIFRNGTSLARYPVEGAQQFGSDSAVVIGLRHLEAQDGACLAGSIDDARIYGTALTAAQIAALRPNQPSDPAPLA